MKILKQKKQEEKELEKLNHLPYIVKRDVLRLRFVKNQREDKMDFLRVC